MQKNQHTQRKLFNFEFWILVIKVIEKLILSKNFNNKKCAPKLVFFNEKKTRKIWMIFDIENWL